MKNDYTKLDEAILIALSERSRKFYEITREARVLLESQALAKSVAKGLSSDKPAWRFVDSRLQAMRKAGKVAFRGAKEGWVAT